MNTLLEILIWLGSGFAFSAGIFVGFWISKRINKKEAHRVDEHNERVLEALIERNRLTVEANQSRSELLELEKRRHSNEHTS